MCPSSRRWNCGLSWRRERVSRSILRSVIRPEMETGDEIYPKEPWRAEWEAIYVIAPSRLFYECPPSPYRRSRFPGFECHVSKSLRVETRFPRPHLSGLPGECRPDARGSARGIVALQRGLAHVLLADRESASSPVFLDLRPPLKKEFYFEAGLHAVVFHPDFAKNRRVFLSYSQANPRRNVQTEMQVPVGTFAADPSSERVLHEIPHQLADHWAAWPSGRTGCCILPSATVDCVMIRWGWRSIPFSSRERS